MWVEYPAKWVLGLSLFFLRGLKFECHDMVTSVALFAIPRSRSSPAVIGILPSVDHVSSQQWRVLQTTTVTHVDIAVFHMLGKILKSSRSR